MKKRQKPLSPKEKKEITEFLHMSIVANILQSKNWVCKDVVFQGGTALHLAWKSPRYSEDLDFLINTEKKNEISKAIKKTAVILNKKIQIKYGGNLSLIEKKGPENTMMVYNFTYSHPEKRGKILVKTEFMQTSLQNFQKYGSVLQELKSDSLDVLVKPYVQVADMKSLYADKIVAITQRPYLKTRDYFDLWWLRNCSNAISDHTTWTDQFIDKMETDFAIYDIHQDDFMTNMDKVCELDKTELTETLKKDLKNWLPAETYTLFATNNLFNQIINFVHQEIVDVRQTLQDNLSLSCPSM